MPAVGFQAAFFSCFLVLLAISCPRMLAQAPHAPIQTARVEGQIISATTGEPLKKVQVLVALDDKHRYATSTDAQGKFVFEDLPPGDYSLSAERVAYLDGHAESDISASPGESVRDILLKLIPAGVISGRVVDEDGDPVPSGEAGIKRYVGKRELYTESMGVNGEGGFTFTGLKPGRYYLDATTQSIGAAPQPGRKGNEEAFAETFYPSALDQASSIPIDLKPGAEFRNLEIRLRKQRVFRVRGAITGADSDGPLKLSLIPRDRSGHAFSSSTSKGYFEFADVPPGSYWIRVDATQTSVDRSTYSMTSRRQTLFCNYPVEVADKNLENLAVPLVPGASITGKVSTDGVKAENMHADKPLHVSLEAFESFLPSPPEAAVGADGTFQINFLPFDRFRVQIGPLPDGAYLKSIRFNAQEAADKRIDLTSGTGGTLEIALAPNAAEISGVVRNNKGNPIRAGVYAWIGAEDLPQFARSGKDGGFVLRNLAPGDYHVAAVASEDNDAFDLESLKPPESLATKLTVQEGSRERLELELIAMDAIESAKIP